MFRHNLHHLQGVVVICIFIKKNSVGIWYINIYNKMLYTVII
jgi:hypothetical protein